MSRKRGGNGSATAGGILFQESVGTLFAAWLLSDWVIDRRLGLPNAKVVSLASETDSPVDDLLVATSDGGYVAVQAKTGLSLSAKRGGRFHDTITQFVDHWRAGARGEGELGWNRQLDPAIDRLVLAVDLKTALTVREDLPAALHHLCEPGSTALAADKQRALEVFRSCVEDAWLDATGAEPEPGFAAELAQVVKVFVFDPSDRDRTELILQQGLAEGIDASSVLTALEKTVIEMMANRGSAGSRGLRAKLMSKGVVLAPPRRIANDVRAIRAHSASTTEQLHRYERIGLGSDPGVSIQRECQSSIDQAAHEGSLLIVGEAGIGKSAVLNALGRNLRSRDADVVQLAVDRHSVQTLEGLGRELGLEQDLVKILDAWDGQEPGWLLIDGLDAARGGETEGVFRALIKRTLELGGRWRVVASIRTFDLQMGAELRRLFQGEAPDGELSDSRFGGVRHINVPGWTEAEYADLLERAPALRGALNDAPRALVDLARVPFNTNLIGELLEHGVDALRLGEVSSQVQLLRLYWRERIGGYGTPGQVCLFKTVEAMIRARVLYAAKHEVDFAQPHVFDDLSSAGVLMDAPDETLVQFRHHVLFDFAAARRLRASDPIGGHPDLRKERANGLLLAPAMRFALQELWESDVTREPFWTALESMLKDESLDPVIGTTAARMGAELPLGRTDLAPVLSAVGGGSADAAGALQRIAGALVITLEDEPGRRIEPWVAMLSELAPHVDKVANVFRLLLFAFVERADDPELRAGIGIAARALLGYALSGQEEGSLLTRAAIGFVAKTYDTDTAASRRLLRAVFDEARFERCGPDEIPAVCDGAKAVMASDPEFVAEIYRLTYAREVAEDRETNLSSSQILALTSTARQDYGMARYHLETLFEEFLVAHPKQAVRAMEDAVEGYLAREDPISETAGVYDFMVSGREVRLREDRSWLWAHDPEESYADDAPALVVKLLETLKSCDEDLAIEIAGHLSGGASLAVFWSRAFAAAAERGDGVLDCMLPYAIEGPFLIAYETRKDAVDVVAEGYDRMSTGDREAFERRVLSLDFARFGEGAREARQECLETLFSAIGRSRLATEAARRMLGGGDGIGGRERANRRPFRVVSGSGGVEDWGDVAEADDAGLESARAAAAIRAAEEAMRPGTDDGGPVSGSFDEVCAVLEDVERAIRGDVDDELVRQGEGVIGRGCLAICKGDLLPAMQDVPRTERYVRLLQVASSSAGPIVEQDTEAQYEDSAFWGSPAARVEAAEAVPLTLGVRPDLLVRLSRDLDRLLVDPHPAVRMHAVVNLGSIRKLDPTGFRERLSARVRCEKNAAVLRFLSATVLRGTISEDVAIAESLVVELLEKWTGDSEAVRRLRTSLAVNLTILAVAHERSEAIAIIEGWIGDCAVHCRELERALATMREGYTRGLRAGGSGQDEPLRRRCLELASRIGEAAATDFTGRAARAGRDDSEAELARRSAQLLDRVCGELAASVIGQKDRRGSGERPDPGLGRILAEASPLLECLAGAGTPHTVYRLLEILEYLMPLDPGKAFDIAMLAALGGGRRSGFQFESMGADRLVGMVGRLLADERKVFKSVERRRTLVRCLELFASVGWPSASRLLYRLPELFR